MELKNGKVTRCEIGIWKETRILMQIGRNMKQEKAECGCGCVKIFMVTELSGSRGRIMEGTKKSILEP